MIAPETRWVTVGRGVRIPYADRGPRGSVPVVLVHGLGDSLRSYDLVMAHLSDDVRALALSLRGHGDADRPDDGYWPADHVADLEAMLNSAGVEKAVLAGHSSGSQIAQLFAITHPQRVRGLVLIGAPGPHPDPEASAAMTAEISALADPIDEGWLREFAESTVAGTIPQDFLDTIVAEARKVPARVYRAMWSGIRNFDLSRELRRITAPTILVWGDRDRVPVATLEAQRQLVAAIPRARLIIYPGAGHSPHWEHPRRFAADVASFVRGLPT